MPTNITDVDTFTAIVTSIADGEPLSKAYLTDLAPQALSNRTRFLYNRLPAGAGGEIAIPIISANATGATFSFSAATPRWASNTSTPTFHIEVPHIFGAALVSVKATIQGSASLAALPSQLPSLGVYRTDRNAPTTGVLDDSVTDASGSLAAYQTAHTLELNLATPRAFDDYQFTAYLEGDDGGVANFFFWYLEMVVAAA